MASLVPQFTLVTQNVDGFHERAGSPDVVELHGSIARVKCSGCDRIVTDSADTDEGPVCPDCLALLRPDVVWFGELVPLGAIERAQRVALLGEAAASL